LGLFVVRTYEWGVRYTSDCRGLKMEPTTIMQDDTSSQRAPVWAEALTEREWEVATSVASGASNSEIAAELFMSYKTVEAHLTRVYRKFGVRNRTQLVIAIGRSTLAA
jgi:DNA-binding NarL/FixJ family response regulator